MPRGLSGRDRPSKLLVTTDAVGGVWRYALDLAAGLHAQDVGLVLAVVGPGPSAAQRDEAEAAGAHLITTGLPLDWTADSSDELRGAQRMLEQLALDAGCDAVHLHAPAFAGAGPWPLPCVAVAHSCVATWWQAVRSGPMPQDFAWRTQLAAAGLRSTGAVIAPTQAHGRATAAAYGLNWDRFEVVHNGRRAAPHGPASRVRDRNVLAVGRLWDEGKGISALDRVAALLDVPVRAAGPVRGPSGASIALHSSQHLGELEESALAREYATCGVFVSTARYEPFGLAILEAAQSGMPLVLSDIPSLRELWDTAALFVDPGDDEGLARAVHAALERSADLGHQARARSARYSLHAMVTGTLTVHERVARQRMPH